MSSTLNRVGSAPLTDIHPAEGHWTDPSSIAGKRTFPYNTQRVATQRDKDHEYLHDSEQDLEDHIIITDAATDVSENTTADAITQAFRRPIEDFKTASKQSDGELVGCAQRFSRALRFFVDRALIPKQSEKMLRETGALAQRLYEQQREYVRLVQEREELQNEHLACLERIEADPMSRKLSAKYMPTWRKTLSQMLTSRKVHDLDEYMERIDRLIGLAQPGWSLQTLRTQDLFQPENTNEQVGHNKGGGPQWQLRDHKQLQSEEDTAAAGIAPKWSFEALKQREQLAILQEQLQEQREQLQEQGHDQHFSNNEVTWVIRDEDLIDYSDEEL